MIPKKYDPISIEVVYNWRNIINDFENKLEYVIPKKVDVDLIKLFYPFYDELQIMIKFFDKKKLELFLLSLVVIAQAKSCLKVPLVITKLKS